MVCLPAVFLRPARNLFVSTPTHVPSCLAALKHLPNVGTRFHCPQAFLIFDFQYRDDMSELNQAFWA